MTSWLSKQKKQALLDLSAEAGLKQDDDTRKDDLIDNLDKYLQANSTRLSRNTAFQPYFDTRRTPFKARSASAGGVTSDDGEVKSVVKARGRRTTKVKQETDDESPAILPSPSQALQALVPTSSSLTPSTKTVRRRSQLLPPSPADVADDVEVAARQFYSGLLDTWNDSGLPEFSERVRAQCSSVLAVQATCLAVEGYGLSSAVLPRRYAFSIPSLHLGSLATPGYAVRIPDLFQLVTPGFWTTTLLWASTSVFVPLLVSYFYNLSVKEVKRSGKVVRYGFDPLIFNVVKAVLAYVIYVRGYDFGVLSSRAMAAVNLAMVGGPQSILIGSYVGILVALYEAAQGK